MAVVHREDDVWSSLAAGGGSMKRRRAFAIAVACSAANSCDASVSSLTALALFRHRWQAFVSLLVKGWHKTPRNNRSSVYSEGTMTGAVHLDPARITFMVRQDAQASDLGRCGGLEGHGSTPTTGSAGMTPSCISPTLPTGRAQSSTNLGERA